MVATVDLVESKKFPVKMRRRNRLVLMNLTRVQVRLAACSAPGRSLLCQAQWRGERAELTAVCQRLRQLAVANVSRASWHVGTCSI